MSGPVRIANGEVVIGGIGYDSTEARMLARRILEGADELDGVSIKPGSLEDMAKYFLRDRTPGAFGTATRLRMLCDRVLLERRQIVVEVSESSIRSLLGVQAQEGALPTLMAAASSGSVAIRMRPNEDRSGPVNVTAARDRIIRVALRRVASEREDQHASYAAELELCDDELDDAASDLVRLIDRRTVRVDVTEADLRRLAREAAQSPHGVAASKFDADGGPIRIVAKADPHDGGSGGGLTDVEEEALAALTRAASLLLQLPKQHVNERHEVAEAIHRLQDYVAARPHWRATGNAMTASEVARAESQAE